MLVDVYFVFIMAFSAFLQTVTGFGFSIMTAPLLAIVIGAKLTVMITLVTSLMVKVVILVKSRDLEDGSFKDVWVLLVSSLFFSLPGAYMLKIIDNELLKILLGIMLLFTGVVMWRNFKINITNHNFAKIVAGGLSGFFGSVTSINGPPIVLYYLNAGVDQNKNVFRGNLTRFFLVANIISITYATFMGIFKFNEVAKYLLLSIPALLVGYRFGNVVFAKIDQKTFKVLTLALVFASAIVLLGTTILKKMA